MKRVFLPFSFLEDILSLELIYRMDEHLEMSNLA
jgi:hypothetical protein